MSLQSQLNHARGDAFALLADKEGRFFRLRELRARIKPSRNRVQCRLAHRHHAGFAAFTQYAYLALA